MLVHALDEASFKFQYHKPALLVLFQLPPTRATLENEAKRLTRYKTHQIPYKKSSTEIECRWWRKESNTKRPQTSEQSTIESTADK